MGRNECIVSRGWSLQQASARPGAWRLDMRPPIQRALCANHATTGRGHESIVAISPAADILGLGGSAGGQHARHRPRLSTCTRMDSPEGDDRGGFDAYECGHQGNSEIVLCKVRAENGGKRVVLLVRTARELPSPDSPKSSGPRPPRERSKSSVDASICRGAGAGLWVGPTNANRRLDTSFVLVRVQITDGKRFLDRDDEHARSRDRGGELARRRGAIP